MGKLHIDADIPDEEVEIFLLMIRGFDRAFSGCHFKVTGSADMTTDAMEKLLKRVGYQTVHSMRKQ